MNSRALLTALLLGSAIASTRLMAHIPASAPQAPEQERATERPQCAASARDQAPGPVEPRAMLGLARSLGESRSVMDYDADAFDRAASADLTPTPRCAG